MGNLSDDVSEAELHGLFAGQRGFKQIKVVRGTRWVAQQGTGAAGHRSAEDVPGGNRLGLQGAAGQGSTGYNGHAMYGYVIISIMTLRISGQ